MIEELNIKDLKIEDLRKIKDSIERLVSAKSDAQY